MCAHKSDFTPAVSVVGSQARLGTSGKMLSLRSRAGV